MCRSTTACQASAIDIDALALDAPDIDNDLESYQVDKWHGYQLFERSQVQTLPYHCMRHELQMRSLQTSAPLNQLRCVLLQSTFDCAHAKPGDTFNTVSTAVLSQVLRRHHVMSVFVQQGNLM